MGPRAVPRRLGTTPATASMSRAPHVLDGKLSAMDEGLYESILTSGLEAKLLDLERLEAVLSSVDPADQAHVLTRHLTHAIGQRLGAERAPENRLHLANEILRFLRETDEVSAPVQELFSIRRPPGPGQIARFGQRPKTPLNDAALLTNAHGEPSLASELKAEIDSADTVDLLCAFVMWRGLRLLQEPLGRARDAGVPIRVVTTTYIGGTEREALDRLVRDFGAEVRVQYDAARTRLHAKAWLFRRDTGFDTAYVGSSNLSTSALLEGVEWNVRLSRDATPALLTKFEATFDSYWHSSEFQSYDPDLDGDRLDDALTAARAGGRRDNLSLTISGLEVRPYPYQQEMLDAIQAERVVHDRHRNLVVAATGTGKTVVAALDYRRLCTAQVRPRLLFVAHRREILEQSLRTYREVVSDGDFGELYVGGARPDRWQHVFASVQSLTSYGVANIPSDAYDVVVIDEFHHAEARTYRTLIEHLEPVELLGLTATPERADGLDVRSFFDGRTATELRLWDALGADLLCPFHYFAVADGTDLRDLAWTKGRYDESALSNVYTGNDARTRIVLNALKDKVLDLASIRGLGFCVSVAHAEYMARAFNEAGIPSLAVSGTTPREERASALSDLRARRVNMLFAADLFNEGLDVPEIDTVLFLRPTESATIFMQQLGRGLRRTRDKAVLTVLDFVGYHRKEFRFDRKLRALTGFTRAAVERGVKEGFPFLPSGVQIVMDRQSQQIVLENLKSQIANRWQQIVAELRSQGEMDLGTFLNESGVDLSDILRRGSHSWTRLRRDAGLPTAPGSELEEKLLKRVRAFAHVDDGERAAVYKRLLSDNCPDFGELSPAEQRLARMLYFSLWSDGGGFTSVEAGLGALSHEQATRRELTTVIDISFDAARHEALELASSWSQVPLKVHARYQREEILGALDFPRMPNSMREGVWYSAELNVDCLLMTFKKSEADYSPSTMYADYPISPTLFHWESQSTTSADSPTGRRYLSGLGTVLLFARHEPRDEFGTSPYLFLGEGHYVEHTGSRPVAITWQLDHPMPIEFFNVASAIAM
jgi:superfamily II DNA or RNA helicase/HKD family nuclease